MPGYTVDNETILILSENIKLTPGDSFTVKDQDGNDIFYVQGPLISMTGRKTIVDAQQGTELYRVSEAVISMHKRQYIEDPDMGDSCMTLRKEGILFGAHTVLAWNGPSDDGEPAYNISGGILEKNFDVKDNQADQVVAYVRKQDFNMKHLLLGDDTYAITIAPGQDAALMVAMALVCDDIYAD